MRSAGGSYPEKEIALVLFFTGEFPSKRYVHSYKVW